MQWIKVMSRANRARGRSLATWTRMFTITQSVTWLAKPFFFFLFWTGQTAACKCTLIFKTWKRPIDHFFGKMESQKWVSEHDSQQMMLKWELRVHVWKQLQREGTDEDWRERDKENLKNKSTVFLQSVIKTCTPMLAPPGGTELLRGHAEQQKTTKQQ